MRKCASSNSASFLVFPSAYSQDPSLIFTSNTSNDVVSREDVPFGGHENKIFHFDPLSSKNAHFWQSFERTSLKFRVKKALTVGMLSKYHKR